MGGGSRSTPWGGGTGEKVCYLRFVKDLESFILECQERFNDLRKNLWAFIYAQQKADNCRNLES